jgi:hypothetical protein
MRVGWNYAWRFGLGTVIGAGTAACLAVGICCGPTGLIVAGVAGIGVLALYIVAVIAPWLRRWSASAIANS